MKIDFDKNSVGLVPAIIQDVETKNVLMLAYMNKEAIDLTLESKKVHFFSRSKNRIWMKGEVSGNFLNLISLKGDCDNDSLLLKVKPQGPTCHKGDDTCWGEKNDQNFLNILEEIIADRIINPSDNSYISNLFEKGIDKIAQKVGEESTEVIIASKNENKKELIYESADLLFHFLLLLQKKNLRFKDVVSELERRNN
ncbi:MAG: bifunctional phosphoribosyl-AMP cyclohydrolase/phosphoribosyl-ATP diphosphatase HisIE [Flavobacteriaceae bacterium]